KGLTEFGFEWLASTREKYHTSDFGSVFEKYINN
ncbi:MAG TPA: YvbH-like oligomerization domain-containing protein, partial [Bacillaceae bacterium]|nr:YvbH-like oligomerization domain-containing protein [Bacillaceae bacterium]